MMISFLMNFLKMWLVLGKKVTLRVYAQIDFDTGHSVKHTLLEQFFPVSEVKVSC